MAEQKHYWKGLAEFDENVSMEKLRQNEFPEEIPVDEFLGNAAALSDSQTSRRDFLKYLGFSTAAATLAACEAPIVESIPYVVKPDELIPGVPNYYASAFYDGHDFASVLVKTREGRPIKLEPNKESSFNGSTNARVQASVLSLYDNGRLKEPMKGGEPSSLADIDKEVKGKLASAKNVALLSHSVNSPSYLKMIAEVHANKLGLRHIAYDSVSRSAQLDAWAKLTGKRSFPSTDLSSARVIVAVGADFLSGYNGQSVAGDYAKSRQPGKGMSRHYQFESNMSLSGANADHRVRIKASEQSHVLLELYNQIAKLTNNKALNSSKLNPNAKSIVEQAARDLLRAQGNSIVMNGGNSEADETLTVGINRMLGNEGKTVLVNKRLHIRKGDETAYENLLSDLKAGNIDVLILDRVNPSYDRPGFEKMLKDSTYTVALSDRMDETAVFADVVVPTTHFLENWSDMQPKDDYAAIAQPVIRPLFKESRSAEESLMSFFGISGSYYDYIHANWRNRLASSGSSWNHFVHDGFVTLPSSNVEQLEGEEMADASQLISAAAKKAANTQSKGIEVVFYEKAGMGTGSMSNNPWLQEMPDPITRTSWDNYLTVSAAQAMELGVENRNISDGSLEGSKVNLTVNGVTLNDVPVLIQPGQAYGTLGLAVGYGRSKAGKAGNSVGVNAYALMKSAQLWADDARVEKSGSSDHGFACTQLHHTMMGRDIVKEINLDTFLNEPAKGSGGWNNRPEFETYRGPLTSDEANLWQDFDHETGHFWNLSIDLSKCIGCGACVIACHAENNVPVVGKDEVRRSRDMHWLRIDRYYSSDMTEERAEAEGISGITKFERMEDPGEAPEVVFQPVMCQHCNHAPCETVCPVAATTHSAEGLNHMAYNRCIGTRYCANNCPYKVRRFNWFLYHDNQDQFDVNYAMNDDLGKMVLNPDVTVRSRGVMEKCSMCIQRIQYGKLEAKKGSRPVKDGEIVTACAQACETGAIAFGDANDSESQVAELKKDERMYYLLDEVGTQPSVFYQTKVRNKA
jgi:molybdopterin-containing oxidoreductase family iron-sulfur binding subunit